MAQSYYEQECKKRGIKIPLYSQILRQAKQMELKEARKKKKVVAK